VHFYDPKDKLNEVLKGDHCEYPENSKEDLEKMLLAMALNHGIVIDSSTGKYNSASPDELALVNFAK
jgi:magnesium-transporting ATPase (P-type)